MRALGRLCLAAGLAVMTAGFVTPVVAREVWKFGTAALPGTVLYDIANKFIKDFNVVAGDEITIEYLNVPNEQEMCQQVVRGGIQMGGSPFLQPAVPASTRLAINISVARKTVRSACRSLIGA